MARDVEEGVEIVSCRIVGNRLVEAMAHRGLSQEETARRTRVMTSRQLGRFIKNEHCPSFERAAALSTVLGVAIDKLFKLDIKTRKTLPPLRGRGDE
jgi:transcriptional regulator with XRE-family HTH domain